MTDGNRNGGRNGDEYEEENGHEARDGGGGGSVNVDKTGRRPEGKESPGN